MVITRERVITSFAATVLDARAVASETQACPEALQSLVTVVRDTKKAVRQPVSQADSEEDHVYPKSSDLEIDSIRSGADFIKNVKKSDGRYGNDAARVRCVRRKQNLRFKHAATTSQKSRDDPGPITAPAQTAFLGNLLTSPPSPSRLKGQGLLGLCSKATPVCESLSWMPESCTIADTLCSVVVFLTLTILPQIEVVPRDPTSCIDLPTTQSLIISDYKVGGRILGTL